MITAFLYIIESPSPDDLLDGRTEGRVLSEALNLAGIPHSYSIAVDERTLDEALDKRLIEAWTKHQQPPILHLSMHGDTNGVALTNGAILKWDQLRQKLLPIMRVMPNGLLICMSSCFGFAGCRLAMYSDHEPHFWALIGHTDSVDWADAAIAYVTFYHRFFKGHTVAACVEAMKVASGDSRFDVAVGAVAKRGWTEYIQQLNLPVPTGSFLQVVGAQLSVAGSALPEPPRPGR